jgi:hypothetical protein
MSNLSNRLARLEASNPQQLTWKEFISLDDASWAEMQKQNPVLYAKWQAWIDDRPPEQYKRSMETLAAALGEITGEAVTPSQAEAALSELDDDTDRSRSNP